MSLHTEIIATLWNCSFCNTKANLGVYPDTGKQVRRCPKCGAPVPEPVKGKGVKGNPYYIPSESEQIKLKSDYAEKLAEAGPNWTCSSCRSAVSPLRKCCDNCGTKQDGKKVKFRKKKSNYKKKTSKKKTINTSKSSSRRKGLFKGYKVFLAIATIAVLFLFGRGVYLYQHYKLVTSQGEVTTTQWESNIETEKFAKFSKENWKSDGVPYGAYNIRESKKVKKHKKVADGREKVKVTKTRKVKHTRPITKTRTVNKANGTAVKETYTSKEIYYENEEYTVDEWKTKYKKEPVYATYVKYAVNKWSLAKTLKLTGTDCSPYWPVFKPKLRSPAQINDLRERKRYIAYWANVKENKNVKNGNDERRIFKLNLDSTSWLTVNTGDIINLSYFSNGELEKIYSPKEWQERLDNADSISEQEKNKWFYVWKKNAIIVGIVMTVISLFFLFLILFRWKLKK